jgi:hypothetical protein
MNSRRRSRRKPYGHTRYDIAGVSTRPSAPARQAGRQVSATAFVGLAALGVAAMLAVIGVRWFTGPDFLIAPERIRVENNAGIPAGTIMAVSGLVDEHVLFADVAAAAERLNAAPGIDAAEVSCEWSGQAACRILVKVSLALAVWQGPAGVVWVDGGGRVQVGTGEAPGDVPGAVQVRAEPGDMPEPGTRVASDLLRALGELHDLQPSTQPYSYSARYGLMYTDERGWRIRLGVAERDGDIGRKLALVKQLRDQLNARGTSPGTIDARYLDAPYYLTVDP